MNSSTTSEKWLVALGGLTLIAVTVPAAVVLNGWALSILWRWFVVATFHVQALTITQAIGVTMVVTYLTHEEHDSKSAQGTKGWVGVLVRLIAKPLVALAFGWTITQFM